MHFSPKGTEPISASVEPIAAGLGLSILECSVSRNKGSVQARFVVYKKDGVGVADCSRLHRAMEPRLELAFPNQEIYIEVASPGIDKQIKDASEFPILVGRGVRCYRTDLSDWSAGIVVEASEESVVLRSKAETQTIPYGVIAKAKLDYSQEVEP